MKKKIRLKERNQYIYTSVSGSHGSFFVSLKYKTFYRKVFSVYLDGPQRLVAFKDVFNSLVFVL